MSPIGSGKTPMPTVAAFSNLECMTGPQIHPRDLRVSDAERAHALQLLERATGRGYIDIGEFSDRSRRAMEARTRADLNLLLLDLPGLQLSGRPYDPASTLPEPTPSAAAAPRSPGDVLQLRGYGSRQFTGNWTVPSLITVEGMGAGTKLDFTQAHLTTPHVTIDFRSNLGGTTHLRVPPGTAVRYEGLDLRGAAVHNNVPSAGFHGPPPLSLSLVGVKRYGAIHIRQPRTGGLKKIVTDLVDGWR